MHACSFQTHSPMKTVVNRGEDPKGSQRMQEEDRERGSWPLLRVGLVVLPLSIGKF